jgi:hypothetical protein
MTANELRNYIGKEGDWTVNAGAGVTVRVKTKDARIMFGRVDVLVTPVTGTGEVWVDSQFLGDLH